MPRPWTVKEKKSHLLELQDLYVRDNKTIGEIGKLLGIAEQTVFQRLKRLGIRSRPELKANYLLRKRTDIKIPRKYTPALAEFFGIMLGDGKLSKYQIVVTFGSKEPNYINYVVDLIQKIFYARPRVGIRKTGYRDAYLGSIELSKWLSSQGLVYNKVLSQVNVPKWVFNKQEFMRGFLRGFFDTDGSIYKLRWGLQISFTNKSKPLLRSVRKMLICLGYNPSKMSDNRVYITKRNNVVRFIREIAPKNFRHEARFKTFLKNIEWVGTEVVKRDWL